METVTMTMEKFKVFEEIKRGLEQSEQTLAEFQFTTTQMLRFLSQRGILDEFTEWVQQELPRSTGSDCAAIQLVLDIVEYTEY